MVAVLVFAVCLFLAVLVSERANRTVLSTAVVFLFAGFFAGDTVLGFVSLTPNDPVVVTFAGLALFSVLFTDGMRVGLRDLTSAWRLPGRALLLGLPLTLLGNALLAHYVAGLPWAESFLIGAVLSPTDPVFAAAIVGREEVPGRLRHLLNVESGINDGLALPFVIAFLAIASEDAFDIGLVSGEVALGIAIGIAIPAAAIFLERNRFFSATTLYEPLNAFSIGLIVLALSQLTHANEYLAAFAAGVTVASLSQAVRSAFHQFGELITELLKLAALLVFGALISIEFLREIEPSGYLFALLVLVIVRPIALGIALLWSPLSLREWVAVAWFGPKGFASVVYALLILEAGIPLGDEIFHLVAIVIIGSIVAHSSTDIIVARWFDEPQEAAAPTENSPT